MISLGSTWAQVEINFPVGTAYEHLSNTAQYFLNRLLFVPFIMNIF
jgi:hypothetical protein